MGSATAGVGSLPTRSEIEGWDTSELENAASTWRAAAAQSEQVFDQHRQNIAALHLAAPRGKATPRTRRSTV